MVNDINENMITELITDTKSELKIDHLYEGRSLTCSTDISKELINSILLSEYLNTDAKTDYLYCTLQYFSTSSM